KTLLSAILPNKKTDTTLSHKNITVDSLQKKANNPFTIVAIGASAGGLEAITQLLQNLSPTTGMAFIYVQHLSPNHKSILSSILSKITQMQVQDIDDMEKMIPNNVYVIPYNKGIEVTDGHIKLIPRSSSAAVISIDILFSSLAQTHKENVIGVVLSGSAHDGTMGLQAIKRAGGVTFAQDDSAKFTSMPHSAIAEGIVDYILSPAAIGIELSQMSKNPLEIKKETKQVFAFDFDNNNPDLNNIVQYLHNKKNVDFSHYKMNTIKRRIFAKNAYQ
ncbi:MAG: two-component system, chemotaxis family, CheB/CheR fusion protein, partial [Bacteroidota bacterium]|nr:two-component system, chemotaxis family, CheB/CheR fusion protein [Bacteroidota bacterium]